MENNFTRGEHIEKEKMEQLPNINVEFVVGNNDLDFYKFLKENGGLPDITTCCCFSLHDASPLKNSLMDFSEKRINIVFSLKIPISLLLGFYRIF